MKLPLDQRTAFADSVLVKVWPVSYWNREEQLFACAEGWALNIFLPPYDRIGRWDYGDNGEYTEFKTDQEAVAYVLKRAQEGSPLHCRAITLHAASVLKYGEQS